MKFINRIRLLNINFLTFSQLRESRKLSNQISPQTVLVQSVSIKAQPNVSPRRIFCLSEQVYVVDICAPFPVNHHPHFLISM